MSRSQTDYILVHFVCGKYPEDMGGVARFDNLIERIFPSRVFFKGPEEASKMNNFLADNADQKILIITDNQFAIHVPELFPCLIFHHGVARIHAQRDPQWEKEIADFCINGQDEMLSKRNPHNTVFVGVSSYCLDYFEKLYQKNYTRFLRYCLPHPIEPVSNLSKRTPSKPVILGSTYQSCSIKEDPFPAPNNTALSEGVTAELIAQVDAPPFDVNEIPGFPPVDHHIPGQLQVSI